jgi:hypothetical protein
VGLTHPLEAGTLVKLDVVMIRTVIPLGGRVSFWHAKDRVATRMESRESRCHAEPKKKISEGLVPLENRNESDRIFCRS